MMTSGACSQPKILATPDNRLGTGLGDRFGVPQGISGTVKATIGQGAKPA